MEINALLKEISDEAPSGENLEYDSKFTDLELAAGPKEEQQIGDEVIAAQAPDYPDVKVKALALLEESHDLRAAMYLGLAELSISGFIGFAQVTTYIRRCLEERWESCHPQLDADDNNDPMMRINAIKAMVDPNGLLRSIRRVPLTDSRGFGNFGFRDIEFASGVRKPPKDETVVDISEIAAAFKDTDEAKVSEIEAAVSTIRDDITAIDAVFDRETPGQGPDLQLLKSLLSELSKKLGEFTGNADVLEATADSGGEPFAGTPSQSFGGSVNNPTDVVRALDQIMAYYARSEPSSPLPLLLERAKRLVSADFMTIVKDLAPQGMDNVNVVGGIKAEDGY